MKINAFKRGMRECGIAKIFLVVKITAFSCYLPLWPQRSYSCAKSDPFGKKRIPSKSSQSNPKQTGYDFVYDAKLVKNAKPVTINVTNIILMKRLQIALPIKIYLMIWKKKLFN